MKFLSVMSALIAGSAGVITDDYSQFESKEFEQQIINEISQYDSEQNQLLMSAKIGGPVCQGLKDFSVFDLKKFSLYGRKKAETYASPTITAKGEWIAMKACSTTFTPQDKFKADKAKPKVDDKQCAKFAAKAPGNMYIMNEKGGKSLCANSFKYADFSAEIKKDKKTKKVTSSEWKLKYKSLQKCHTDNKKDFEVKVKGVCAPKAKKATLKVTSKKACDVELTYTSKDACIAATFPLQKYMGKIAPFTGIVMIVGGLACAFFGSKFVPLAISFMMFIAGSGGVFMVGYNFLPPTTVKMASLIALLVVAVLIGVLIAWIAYKFLQAWSVSILGGWLGIVLVMFLLKMAGVKNQNVVLGSALIAAIGFGILANKFKAGIKRLGTAFIGSFIVIRGVASYAGGFPTEFATSGKEAAALDYGSKEAVFVYAYFAGFLVLGILGFWVQKKYLELPEEDDDKFDEMKGEDEAKVCGCF